MFWDLSSCFQVSPGFILSRLSNRDKIMSCLCVCPSVSTLTAEPFHTKRNVVKQLSNELSLWQLYGCHPKSCLGCHQGKKTLSHWQPAQSCHCDNLKWQLWQPNSSHRVVHGTVSVLTTPGAKVVTDRLSKLSHSCHDDNFRDVTVTTLGRLSMGQRLFSLMTT